MENKIQVEIPREDSKSKIIGINGCNIKTFQDEMGVKVIIDDTPNVIFLVGDDSKKLEIARIVMRRLIKDGKITPDAIRDYKKLIDES